VWLDLVHKEEGFKGGYEAQKEGRQEHPIGERNMRKKTEIICHKGNNGGTKNVPQRANTIHRPS